MRKLAFKLFATASLFLFGATCALAQSAPGISLNIGNTGAKTGDVSSALEIVALLTVLSLAPAILMLMTSFTRIVIILSFVRNAIGTATIPPNQVIIGLSLFLTFFVMGPTFGQIDHDAVEPMLSHSIQPKEAMLRAEAPLRKFMLHNTYESDLEMFMNIRHETANSPEDVNFTTLVPSFIISELKTAFIVGFYIFVPFLIIDLIVASGLMSMGMMMLPPTVISLPAKILVFVLSNGWAAVVTAIMAGYR